MNVDKQVKEFHEMFNHPVASIAAVPETIIDEATGKIKDTAELRLKLILEELEELAVASGRRATFQTLMYEMLIKDGCIDQDGVIQTDADSFEADIVECADAFGDLRYVLEGAILTYGLHPYMDAVNDDIHRSNMSKLCKGLPEAIATQENYRTLGVETHFELVKDDLYAIYRTEDGKILKSINYRPANLRPILFPNE